MVATEVECLEFLVKYKLNSLMSLKKVKKNFQRNFVEASIRNPLKESSCPVQPKRIQNPVKHL